MDLRRQLCEEELEHALRNCLREGHLPDPFLYVGSHGAQRWLALDRSEEFDIAGKLTELLRSSVARIIPHLPRTMGLLAIGVGDGRKECILLKAMTQRGARQYVAVDISETMVKTALTSAADLNVSMRGVVGFCEDLPEYREEMDSPALLCLLGNNFCNYDPGRLLTMLRRAARRGDLLLFDCHLLPETKEKRHKWEMHVAQAYRGEANRHFNLAPLVRHGMNPSQAGFQLDLVTVPSPIGPVVRTRKEIQILRDVLLEFSDGPLPLATGQTLEMGFTYKYETNQVHRLLAHYRWSVVEECSDDSEEYLLILAEPQSQEQES